MLCCNSSSLHLEQLALDEIVFELSKRYINKNRKAYLELAK